MIQPDSTQNSRSDAYCSNGKLVSAALAAIACVGTAATIGIGTATSTEIPKGSVGLTEDDGKIRIRPAGAYMFGSLRFPDVILVTPGEKIEQHVELVFTPQALDKAVAFGRKSIIVNLLPVVGDLTREKLTDHVKVEVKLNYTVPHDINGMLLYGGSRNWQQDAVARACYEALLPSEDKLDNTYFKPKATTLEEAIKAQLKTCLLMESEVSVVSVSKFVQNAQSEFAAYRSKHAPNFVVDESK